VPVLILCALIGLTVGAAVLGFLQAPSSADLAVHNAVGETVATNFSAVSSSSQTKNVTTIVFTPPSRVKLAAAPALGKPPTRTVVVQGAEGTRELGPITSIGTITGFTKVNGVYKAPVTNPTLSAEGASEQVSITLANGYLNRVTERLTIESTTAQGALSGTLKFLEVGGIKQPIG
jgi:hypothetical protein